MLKAVRADLAIIQERDPAARGLLEILMCYPGFHALTLHVNPNLQKCEFMRAYMHSCV